MTCPYCGYDGDDDEFILEEDLAAATSLVREAAFADIQDHFTALFEDMGRRSGGLIKVKTTRRKPVRTTARKPQPEDLLRAVGCDRCARAYAVHGVGLFCPDCGAGNLHVHLARENELLLEVLAEAEKLGLEGGRERAHRRLGNANEDVVTMFEGYMKRLFTFLVFARLPEVERSSSLRRVKNSFQNVNRTRERFKEFNFDPFDTTALTDLERFVQFLSARHVVGHNLSVIDEQYLSSGGAGRVGESLTLDATAVEWFAETASAIVLYTSSSFSEFRL